MSDGYSTGYEHGWNDGWNEGWNACIKQALEYLNDPEYSKTEIAAGMALALESNLEGN